MTLAAFLLIKGHAGFLLVRSLVFTFNNFFHLMSSSDAEPAFPKAAWRFLLGEHWKLHNRSFGWQLRGLGEILKCLFSRHGFEQIRTNHATSSLGVEVAALTTNAFDPIVFDPLGRYAAP